MQPHFRPPGLLGSQGFACNSNAQACKEASKADCCLGFIRLQSQAKPFGQSTPSVRSLLVIMPLHQLWHRGCCVGRQMENRVKECAETHQTNQTMNRANTNRLTSHAGLRITWGLMLGLMLWAIPQRSVAGGQGYILFTPMSGNLPTGDSTNAAYPASSGWSQLPAMSVDIVQAVTFSSGSVGVGKVTFDPLSLQRLINSLSPTLFKNGCSGTPYSYITIALCRPNTVTGASFEFFRLKVGLAVLTKQSWTFSTGTTDAAETASFAYGAMYLTFTPQNTDGSAGAAVSAGWDIIKNVSWDGTSTP